MIINRRGNYEHICLSQQGVDFLHIIFLYTNAVSFCMAVFAGQTARDLFLTYINHICLMANGFCAFPKCIYHLFRC